MCFGGSCSPCHGYEGNIMANMIFTTVYVAQTIMFDFVPAFKNADSAGFRHIFELPSHFALDFILRVHCSYLRINVDP